MIGIVFNTFGKKDSILRALKNRKEGIGMPVWEKVATDAEIVKRTEKAICFQLGDTLSFWFPAKLVEEKKGLAILTGNADFKTRITFTGAEPREMDWETFKTYIKMPDKPKVEEAKEGELVYQTTRDAFLSQNKDLCTFKTIGGGMFKINKGYVSMNGDIVILRVPDNLTIEIDYDGVVVATPIKKVEEKLFKY